MASGKQQRKAGGGQNDHHLTHAVMVARQCEKVKAYPKTSRFPFGELQY